MKRLLVYAPNWLGDAVMSLPAIGDVRRGLPDASIVVAARASVAPLFTMVGDVNDVIALDTNGRHAFSGFDAALLLPNSFGSALRVARAGIPERWGYQTDWRGLLLTRRVQRAPPGVHQIEYYQQLVHALGFPNGPIAPRLDLSSRLRDDGERVLGDAGWDGHRPLVALAPSAAFGSAKRWPAASFAALAAGLAADGVGIVIIGAAGDADRASAVVRALPPGVPTLDLVGKTDVPTLAGTLVHCRTLVTNDSGPMHLAAALGVPVTAVYGPTDELRTAPIGAVRLKPDTTESRTTANGAVRLKPDTTKDHTTAKGGSVRLQPDHVVLAHPVWCRPCWLRECPLDHCCMREVGVAAVLDQARRTL